MRASRRLIIPETCMLRLDQYEAIVLGGGPVGLLAALALARTRSTALLTDRLPAATDAPRVEAVPAALLTLLLEFGLHPAELGVRQLYESRISAWETAVPTTQVIPATAHLQRPALELALLRCALNTPRLDVYEGSVTPALWQELQQGKALVLDATGRRAVTATTRTRPPQPWASRSFWAVNEHHPCDGTFMLAALPEGYAYRLGSAGRLGLGLVGRGHCLMASPAEIRRQLQAAEADWLLDGLPPLETLQPGKATGAAVQWTAGESSIRLGDAALARDALSSQGLACGLSESLYAAAVRTPQERAWFSDRQRQQRDAHIKSLVDLLTRSRHAQAPLWANYLNFLLDQTIGTPPNTVLTLQHNYSVLALSDRVTR